MQKSTFRLLGGAWIVALSYASSGLPLAAEPFVRFAVAPAQIQALGIQTAAMQQHAAGVHATFPAQVSVPPNAEQVVSAPVAGMVTQLLVQPNQAVRTGAPLLHITSAELGQLQLQLMQARTRATLARQNARRDQQLFDEGIIPQRRIQEAQATLQEAEAALDQAKAALRLGGMPTATINQIASSGKPQDGITLTAAKSGIITEIAVKPGQRVDATSALLHIVQSDTLWLDIQIPVGQSTHWKPGTRLKIKGRDIEGRVISSGTTVSSDSQTVMLRAEVANRAAQLRPGEYVTVELPILTAQEGWDVPLSAIARDGNQTFLFVRTADGFEARPAKVLASGAQRSRVQAPVKAGEHIAVSGLIALKGAWLDKRERK